MQNGPMPNKLAKVSSNENGMCPRSNHRECTTNVFIILYCSE